MDLTQVIEQFREGLLQTGWAEGLAVFFGILSVWLSSRGNIWVYPTGLVNTILYMVLSYRAGLLGEASVNLYYTILSFMGWYGWSRKDDERKPKLNIRFSDNRERYQHFFFFFVIFLALFFSLRYLKEAFAPGAIPWADALASAAAFTGMWLMTQKRVESWVWWIITNICSIPLYFVKGYVFTSVYYMVLLLMAVYGLFAWKRAAEKMEKL
jgi:nicotinamide mononucleotide transporter